MIKYLSQKFHGFLTCSNFTTTRKSYLCFSSRLCLNSSWWSQLTIDFSVTFIFNWIFSLKEWTFSFKLELLFAILPHSVFEFDLLFSFTNIYLENWTEVSKIFDWLDCLFWNQNIARREIQIADELHRQKPGNFHKFKHFILDHINSFYSLVWKKP